MNAKFAHQRSRYTLHSTFVNGMQNEIKAVNEAIMDAIQQGRTSVNVMFYSSSLGTLASVQEHFKKEGYAVKLRGDAGPKSLFIVWGTQTPPVTNS